MLGNPSNGDRRRVRCAGAAPGPHPGLVVVARG
ncbi:hypothetical protein SFR_1895 [Streptomyces sp. FR-008]|nr:hypothetical protein SFR_1895 [Streptomyces sp. FR-008]